VPGTGISGMVWRPLHDPEDCAAFAKRFQNVMGRWFRIIEPYIDVFWYGEIYGRRFTNSAQAAEYYLEEGERSGHFPNPIFDPIYYRKCASLAIEDSSLVHYITEGGRNGCRPSKYFDPEWYEWQNPDVVKFGCSLLHYLNVGGREYRDPCSEVDMVALSRAYGQMGDGSVLVHLLTNGFIDLERNTAVTQDDMDLVGRQRNFLREIKPNLLRSCYSPSNGRNLLVVQCAQDSKFWTWFDSGKRRDWDLFLNCYAGNFLQTDLAEHVCLQAGTKFTGAFNCWLEFQVLLNHYDYIFFIDDDLVFRFQDISRFFHLMKSYNLDLAQPSLSAASMCVWPVFYNAQRGGMRRTNGVEIMMPALSRRAREILLPYFFYSVSGFGLDLLMAKLAMRSRLSIGVIDDVVVRHEKKIDQSVGTYYEFLREKGINSKYELWRMIKMFHLERVLHEV
jgi:hypothetical protein